MKLLSLAVEHFRCVRKSRLEFGAGLNVLYGPNDLGKSSLAAAIRAALLLQVSSREQEDFLAWDSAGDPYVELVFESEPQRIWRVKKTFGNHPQAFLEESRDGVDFHVDARGREVDSRLSEILRWGLAPPGGKGRPKGMPVTFLSTALMAEQDQVAAIFGQALSSDSDESGRKRLIEALHAAAEDPLFKAVLQQVQERFDEAFLSSGQRRRGKDSPWLKLREQIQQAEDEERQCNEQLQRTRAIETELQDLLSRRLECHEAVRVVAEVFDRADDEYERGNQRAEISGRLNHFRQQLADITAVLEKTTASEARVDDLGQRVARLVLRESEAKTSLMELTSRAEAAKEAFRVQCEDRVRERELKQATLERRKAEILGEQARNDANLDRVRGVKAIAERAQQIESALRVLTNTISQLGREHEESAEAVRIAEEREVALLNVGQLLRSRAAQKGIEEAEKGLAQIDAWRAEAGRKRNAAIAAEINLHAVKLPTPAELDSIRRLQQQLQVARARLEVGLHVRIEPKREIRLTYRSDDAEREERLIHEDSFERNASREIEIEIEGVASMTISGGAADAREAVEHLQVQWLADAQPVFERVGVVTLDELSDVVNQRSRLVGEISEARDAATALEQRVSDQRDWARLRGEHRQELLAADRALEGVDRAALETIARDLDIGDGPALEAHLGKLRSGRPKLVETERARKGKLLEANASSLEKQRALSAAHQELATAQLGIEGDWNALLPELVTKGSTLAEELSATASELQSLADETDKTVAEVREAVDRAEQARSAATSDHERVAEDLRSTEKSRASAEGELKILHEAASKLDVEAARHALQAVEAELGGISAPAREVTESMVTDAQNGVQSAERALREVEDEIQSKRGALHHVGGEVARERTEDAREALRLVRERERIVEIDYGGWALLRETLLEAEQEEGIHLGKVLGDPILRRFGDLTSGRYGKIALGPDLETDTISVAGEGRAVTSLSIGTRDQLSIIFRLTLAEQLGSAVVLDDQLTQSDDGRMAWLRDLIRQMATNIQILVFTCKPGDYLIPSELKPSKKADRVNAFVRPVDLAQVIERSGATERS